MLHQRGEVLPNLSLNTASPLHMESVEFLTLMNCHKFSSFWVKKTKPPWSISVSIFHKIYLRRVNNLVCPTYLLWTKSFKLEALLTSYALYICILDGCHHPWPCVDIFPSSKSRDDFAAQTHCGSVSGLLWLKYDTVLRCVISLVITRHCNLMPATQDHWGPMTLLKFYNFLLFKGAKTSHFTPHTLFN